MNQTLLHHVASQSLRKKTPVIEAGMSVKVSQKIREGDKERVQNFEGLVIATNGGSGVNATFTVRKIVGGIGVEKVFPLHSKNIVKIEILKKAKVRRSKLYYMRERRGKAARMSETHVRDVVVDDEAEKKAAEAAAKKAEEEKKKAEEAEAKAKEADAPAADSEKENAEQPAEAEAAPAEAEKAPEADAKKEDDAQPEQAAEKEGKDKPAEDGEAEKKTKED